MKDKSKSVLLLMLTATMLSLTSCGGSDNNNVLLDEPTPPPSDKSTLKSTTKSALGTEVSNIIGKGFLCDNNLQFSECYDTAKIVVEVFSENPSINSIVQNLFISLSNSIQSRETIKLDYAITKTRMISKLQRHYRKWSNPSTGGLTLSELTSWFRSNTDAELNCRVSLNNCYRGANSFIQALNETNRQTSFRVREIVVNNTFAVQRQGTVLYIRPGTSVSKIKGLITRQQTPDIPNRNFERLRREINAETGKTFICDTQTSKRVCAEIADKILEAYATGKASPTVSRQFVGTRKSRMVQASRQSIEISSSDSVSTILKKLKAHNRRFL